MGARLSSLGLEREVLCGMYLSMAGGVPTFAFSAFSDTIKNRHDYTPEELNTIGSVLQVGVWTSVAGGLFLDKFGPRMTAALSCVMGAAGYLTMYFLTVTDANVPWVCYAVAAYACGQAGAYCYMIALKVCQSQIAPALRGRLVGSLAAWVSLSAGVFTILGKAWFQQEQFFLLLLGGHVCISGVGLTMRKEVSSVNEDLSQTLLSINCVALVTAVVILLAGFLVSPLVFGVLTVASLTAPAVMLAYRSFLPTSEEKKGFLDRHSKADIARMEAAGRKGTMRSKRGRLMEGGFLFVTYFLIFGPCAAALNVFSAFVVSRSDLQEGEVYIRSGPDKTLPDHVGHLVTSMITTFAVANAAGRVITGTVVDKTAHLFNRSLWFVLWGFTGAAALFLLSQASIPATELVSVVVLGLGVGGVQAIIPQLVHDIFGVRNFAAALGCMSFAPSAGSLTFSSINAAFEVHYEDKSFVSLKDDNDTASEVRYCFGKACLENAFLLASVVSFCGAVLSIGVWRRWCACGDLSLINLQGWGIETDSSVTDSSVTEEESGDGPAHLHVTSPEISPLPSSGIVNAAPWSLNYESDSEAK